MRLSVQLGRVLLLLVLDAASLPAQGIISTIAGNGDQALLFSGDGGPATLAALNHPVGIAGDSGGSIYFADYDNQRIRKISPNGIITTIAGTGVGGYSGDGGPATAAMIDQPEGLKVDAAGNVIFADAQNRVIRKITPGGVITTIAGNGTQGFSGDGGPAFMAQLNRPTGIAIDTAGNVYLADSSNQRIRKVTPGGIITTVAGNGTAGYSGDGGPATAAALQFPIGLAVDRNGNLFVADAMNNRIRMITPAGVISTVVGNGAGTFGGDGGPAIKASLNIPQDVAFDAAGNLVIADTENNCIRYVSGGNITTVAGTLNNGFAGDGGPATLAMFNLPVGVAVDTAGDIRVADRDNNRIREVTFPAGPPSLLSNSVVNGASFRPATDPNGAVAAGAMVAIFGNNLALGTATATTTPLPTSLNGASVTFNGVAAPLFFVSPGQINAQAPFQAPAGNVTVQVQRGAAGNATASITMAAFSPGIFTADQRGTGDGAILHASNFAPVNSAAPIAAGEYILIFLTGLGPVQPAVASGAVAPSNPPLAQTPTMPTITIGGLPATVSYSGLAPGFVGLYQVNAQAPSGIAPGSQVLQLSIDGIPANAVTVAVK